MLKMEQLPLCSPVAAGARSAPCFAHREVREGGPRCAASVRRSHRHQAFAPRARLDLAGPLGRSCRRWERGGELTERE